MITASFSIRRLMIATGCAAAFVGVMPARASQATEPVDRVAALRVFHQRVEDYAVLHRRLEGPLPPLTTTRDMRKNYRAQQLLANAIRKERPNARQGNIFSPEIASAFRTIIAAALHGRDVETFLTELQSEHPEVHHIRPVVNAPLPDEATHEMPIVLLRALPLLPQDVEYRIVNHDLALWDIHANLVVDYVPNAFGPVETTVR